MLRMAENSPQDRHRRERSLKLLHAAVGYLRSTEPQSFEAVHLLEMLEPSISHPRLCEVEKREAGHPLQMQDPRDVVEIVNAQAIQQPFRPPRRPAGGVSAVLVLPIVQDATARFFNRQDRGPLKTSAVDDPAQPAADQQHENDQSAQTETQRAAPSARDSLVVNADHSS